SFHLETTVGMRRTLAIVYFAAYGIAALGMAIADTFASEQVAGASSWGFAPGWMREIACFDVFIATLCVSALRALGRSDWPRTCALAMAGLSVLIAANNLAAFVDSGRAGHLQAAITHGVAAVIAVVVARSFSSRWSAIGGGAAAAPAPAGHSRSSPASPRRR